jgi:FtsH-binding integral membrane protein
LFSIVTTAFLGTVCIFASFSASAFFAERRSYLFLGGILGTSLTSLVVIGFMNMLMRSAFLFNVSLYFGLLVFCGFVVFDTQLIIEKASSGQKDFVWDALELFLGMTIFERFNHCRFC